MKTHAGVPAASATGPIWLAYAGLGLVALLLAVLFYPATRSLVAAWLAIETYNYGFMIPPVSAALVWIRRDALRRTPVVPSLGGGAALSSAGLVLLLAGRVATITVMQQLALIITIGGLTLLVLGRRSLAVLAFPIAYLLAMVPFWDAFTASVHPYFQHYSASIGVFALRLFGIPVLRHGFILELPNVTLEVAKECSGVNNLIAVLCVGVPLTMLFLERWWKRLAVLAVSVLVALLSNGIRVATVSLFAYYGIRGADGDIHGPFALLRSVLVSAVGFLTLFGLLSRFRDHADPLEGLWSAGARTSTPPRVRLAPVLVAIGMLSTAVGVSAWQDGGARPVGPDLEALPERLAGWESTGISRPSRLESLGFDRSLSRSYVGPDGATLDVFVGYYDHQSDGRELADYRVRAALMGPDVASRPANLSDTLRVQEFVAAEDGTTLLVTYWYCLDGAVLADVTGTKLHTAWSSLRRRRNDGALVVVRTPLGPGQPIDAGRTKVRRFAEELAAASLRSLSDQ